MTTKHHLTHAEELFWGAAYHPGAYAQHGRKGAQITPPLWHSIVPDTADADGVIASQSISATTGPATGINGALASGGVATFDVPRNVVASWTTTAVMTVTGTDVYGATLVESSASGTTMTGKKAFKTVTAVAVSVNVTLATVGTGDVLGLPYRINNPDEVITWEAGVVDGTGTLVTADTATATATTGDVRGTFDPADAADGSVRFAVMFVNLDPTSKTSLFGVDQYGG